MTEQLSQLERLLVELDLVNREFSLAIRPVERSSELNDEQRQQIGSHLRAVWARWKSVTRRISEVLGAGGADRASGSLSTTENRDEK